MTDAEVIIELLTALEGLSESAADSPEKEGAVAAIANAKEHISHASEPSDDA
jgi:hypothetical protein